MKEATLPYYNRHSTFSQLSDKSEKICYNKKATNWYREFRSKTDKNTS